MHLMPDELLGYSQGDARRALAALSANRGNSLQTNRYWPLPASSAAFAAKPHQPPS